jgi:hypothetical protein
MTTVLRHFKEPLRRNMRFQLETDGNVTLLTADDGRASIDLVYKFLQPASLASIQRAIVEARAHGSATL